MVVESSRPVQVTLSSQVAQPSWKVSHAKNPWKTLMKYVFFLYKRGAGMVRVFLCIYIFTVHIFTVHIFICCMIWQLFHSPHFNYSIDFPPFNVKRDLPSVTQRFPGDGGLGAPQDARPTSPSGVPLASASTENDGSSRPCVRAPGPYTWCLAGLAVRWMMGSFVCWIYSSED